MAKDKHDETGMFISMDVLDLKVKEIVYRTLEKRELTVKEMQVIKEAMRESLEMIIVQKISESRSKERALIFGIIGAIGTVAGILYVMTS